MTCQGTACREQSACWTLKFGKSCMPWPLWLLLADPAQCLCFCTGRRSAHPISSSGLATHHTLARTRCQGIPATLSTAAGEESVEVSSDVHVSDQKRGLDGGVLIFSTSCTLPPTTQRALAVRPGFLTGTNNKYVLSAKGSRI